MTQKADGPSLGKGRAKGKVQTMTDKENKSRQVAILTSVFGNATLDNRGSGN